MAIRAPRFLIVAGEASGDGHGAALVRELKRLAPSSEFFGLAGQRMKAAGVASRFDSGDIAVVGYASVPRVLPQARRILRGLLDSVRSTPPTVAILIDSPGFNLRLARRLKALGVPVIYYVSPQVWAWRPNRVKKIAKRVDLMLVLFPFEAAFYHGHEMPVVDVGHPLVDEVPELPHVWDRAGLGPRMGEGPRLALLPGSRKGEVLALLEPMLDAARRLAASRGAKARLVRAPTIERDWLDRRVAEAGFRRDEITIVDDGRFEILADSHLALCASGTATLEVGLIGTPMLVVYKVGFFTELLGRWLLHLDHIALVNLVLGESAVPELVQGQVEGEYLARRAEELLDDSGAIERMRRSLSKLRPALGQAGASQRAGRAVLELVDRLSNVRQGAT